MIYRTLGKDLKVSAIGLGCMGFTHAYGEPASYTGSKKAIEESIDFGYTFFDTAQCYTGTLPDGTTARNEELVGDALKPSRNKIVLATKFGVTHTPEGLAMDSRPETIRKSVEDSLQRLQTDHIDLYYQHRIDPNVEPETVAETMQELIKEGKILHWGISESNENYLRRAHAVCPVTAIQNRYSMMARKYETLFPTLEELNIGYVAFSPLANGILSDAFKANERFGSGDYRNFMPQYSEEAFEKNRKLFELLRALAYEKQATPAQISLAWMICKKPYIVPIPGSRKTERIKENAASADIILTADEVRAIDEKLDVMEMSEVFGGSPVKKY